MQRITLHFENELALVQFMYNRRFPWYHRNNETHSLTCELDENDISQAAQLYGARIEYHAPLAAVVPSE